MFSYIDPEIRNRLEKDSRIVTLDQDGRLVVNESQAPFLSVLGPIPLPLRIRNTSHLFEWYPFVRRVELSQVQDVASSVQTGKSESLHHLLRTYMSVSSVLTLPGFRESPAPLVRVHSCCMTGDVFGSMRCECGPQLETSFDLILEEGMGAIVYLSSHEGRGIGLWAKAITYLLQDDGQDTYQANVSLGLPEDSRDFTDAAVVLRHLRLGGPIRLLTNNPLKRTQLEQAGQVVLETVPLITGVCEHNVRYMRAKRERGHQIPSV